MPRANPIPPTLDADLATLATIVEQRGVWESRYYELLGKLLIDENASASAVARRLGVTENAIREKKRAALRYRARTRP